jgi:hypothetical protein
MSQELIPLDKFAMEVKEDDNLDFLTKTSDYLPQIRVYGGSSDIVKEGNFPIGHFGLYFNKDQIIDLEEQFDCLICAFRPRACILGSDSPISFYGKFENGIWDCSSAEFNAIKDKSYIGEKGYLCGLEYLLWLPEPSCFALFLMGNKTLRNESKNVKGLWRQAATFKIKFLKNTKGSWHGCSVFTCSTPMEVPEKINSELEKFYNPPESDVELVEEGKRER